MLTEEIQETASVRTTRFGFPLLVTGVGVALLSSGVTLVNQDSRTFGMSLVLSIAIVMLWTPVFVSNLRNSTVIRIWNGFSAVLYLVATLCIGGADNGFRATDVLTRNLYIGGFLLGVFLAAFGIKRLLSERG
ncbi:MAG: hypothetical protein Q4G30_02330 [Actinomycetaceae bacterium]|nr:hypothetical protein [Actinomycetaceae bacterium]